MKTMRTNNIQRWGYLGKGSIMPIGGAARDACYDAIFEVIAGPVPKASERDERPKKVNALIIPFASVECDAGSREKRKFTDRGVPESQVTWLQPGEKLAIGPHVNLVFLSGGDQNQLMAKLDQAARKELRDWLYAGGLIAGTSAGCAVMSWVMIGGWNDEDAPMDVTDCLVMYGLGLGFLRAFCDMHFGERNRYARVTTGIGQFHESQDLGFGFDENTCALISADGILTVYGEGSVHVFDGANVVSDLRNLDAEKFLQSQTGLTRREVAFPGSLSSSDRLTDGQVPDDYAACSDRQTVRNVSGIIYHALSAGAKFNLATRKVTLPRR
jgi:cyanophycinase